MNTQKYTWILTLISTVIVATIAIQLYWNYKNYRTNEQQFINDVQVSLDKAVDDYYSNLAAATTMGFVVSGDGQESLIRDNFFLPDSLMGSNRTKIQFEKFELNADSIQSVSVFSSNHADSVLNHIRHNNQAFKFDSLKSQVRTSKLTSDTLNLLNLQQLTSKVVISFSTDSLNMKTLDSLVALELQRKNIAVDYDLNFKRNLSNLSDGSSEEELDHDSTSYGLSTVSKSTFLPSQSELRITFENASKAILKRIFGGILISIVLVLAVISSLFYLLYIIKKQKQLAEVKNDLISNITHEFKTPIATIGVALESIKDFDVLQNKDKARRYVDMSADQLHKLNIMVEKLLETATLDANTLDLHKENLNIAELLENCCAKYRLMLPEEKSIEFHTSATTIMATVDVFHFENAINNIIDNAIKYGGPQITIGLTTTKNILEVTISDNGSTLSKAHLDRIFDQFYRVPKGNTHDVKGFGIGLYYTKNIIEKHSGSIAVDLKNGRTTFKIRLPHE